MLHYVGLDVSVKKTSVCILDFNEKIIREAKIDSDPEALAIYLLDQKLGYERVGIEAGPLSQWIYVGMAKAGMPMICVETRSAKEFIKQLGSNKNDKKDARGIAKMMARRVYREVHVKTDESQYLRTLLSARKLAQSKSVDVETSIRGLIRNYGLKVGPVSRAKYDARIRELVEFDARLTAAVGPLLALRQCAREQYANLHRDVLKAVREDEVCQLLMTAPGVGPVVALTYKTTIDVPERFKHSRSVGAAIGLVPKQIQSGEKDIMVGITKAGDEDCRTVLVEAALTLLYSGKRNSWLKTWGLNLAERKGTQKATTAVARRLAVVLHRMWITKTPFQWGKAPE